MGGGYRPLGSSAEPHGLSRCAGCKTKTGLNPAFALPTWVFFTQVIHTDWRHRKDWCHSVLAP